MLGGASAVTMLAGIVRSKMVALLLGPAGMGLIGMYQSLTAMVSSIACMGLNVSGVREIAAARGSGDDDRLRATIVTFRRLCWVLALLGAVLLAALAWPLSVFTFKSAAHTVPIAALSLVVLCAVLTCYHTALIQGAQQIRTVALLNASTAVLTVILAVGCFALWRQEGIVPALVVGAVAQYLVARHYSRSLPLPAPAPDTAPSQEIRANLLKLGGLFLFFGIAAAAAAYLQRTIILRQMGDQAVGMFQAASALSMLYASYVLSAMGTDFLPRLTAVAGDSAQINRLVNEQTVVAMLLGIPGIVATIVLARLVIPLFYTSEFGPAIQLLQLMAVGVFGRLVSWPIGFVLIAKMHVRFNVIAELLSHINFFVVLLIGIPLIGLHASGVAPIVVYVIHTALVFWMVHRLTQFSWSGKVRAVVALGVVMIVAALAAAHLIPHPYDLAAGLALLALAAWSSYRQLCQVTELTLSSGLRRLFKPRAAA